MTVNNSSPADGVLGAGVPALEFRPERYEEALGDLDITSEQRLELLGVLWSIMQNMVELGFSVADSKICESIFEPFIEAATTPATKVESLENRPNCSGSKGDQ